MSSQFPLFQDTLQATPEGHDFACICWRRAANNAIQRIVMIAAILELLVDGRQELRDSAQYVQNTFRLKEIVAEMQFVHRRRLLPQLLRKTERAVTNPIAVQPQLFEVEPRCVEHHALGQPVPLVDLHRAGCP